MDPITHGLTGALIGKALFAGEPRPAGAQQAAPLQGCQDAGASKRAAIWICVLAAMFPDVDIFFEPFVRREMATLELHRGVTHSLVCLPLFTAAMATLTWWWMRRRARREPQGLKPPTRPDETARPKPCPPDEKTGARQAAPLGWWMLAGMWAAGIGSHIVLDLATSWGTMVWAPVANARVTWDWVFIIDLALTGMALLPQVVAWVYARREGTVWRAIAMWVVFAACAVGVGAIGNALEAPLAGWAIPATVAGLGVLFFAPAVRDWGSTVSRGAWCRAGLLAMAGYYGMCAWAHGRALAEVRAFAAAQGIRVDAIGALPMPPAATRWLGLIRTPEGVYQSYFNVAGSGPPQFQFRADDKAPEAVARAVEALPEVRTYLWFARFPVMHYHAERGRQVVEFFDLRFFPRNASAPAPFQYRVVTNERGELLEQGWAAALDAEQEH